MASNFSVAVCRGTGRCSKIELMGPNDYVPDTWQDDGKHSKGSVIVRDRKKSKYKAKAAKKARRRNRK